MEGAEGMAAADHRESFYDASMEGQFVVARAVPYRVHPPQHRYSLVRSDFPHVSLCYGHAAPN